MALGDDAASQLEGQPHRKGRTIFGSNYDTSTTPRSQMDEMPLRSSLSRLAAGEEIGGITIIV